jgi:hypothetical protein
MKMLLLVTVMALTLGISAACAPIGSDETGEQHHRATYTFPRGGGGGGGNGG